MEAPLTDTLQLAKVEMRLELLIRPFGEEFVHMFAPQRYNKVKVLDPSLQNSSLLQP